MTRTLALLACLGLLAGCSSSSSPLHAAPVDAGPVVIADAGADVDAAPPSCGDPTSTPDMTCGTLAWATSSTKSRPRNHHVSVVAQTKSGPFLFVTGGFDGSGTLANVDRSSLGADGSLGAWSDMPALPIAMGGHTGGLVGSVFVIAGGLTGSNSVTDASYSAVIGDDGSLSAWKQQGSVLHRRMHGGSFVSGDAIYVLGGFNPTVMNDVVRATVTPDGTVSPWTPAGQLPGPLSHMTVTFVDGYVFLTGGLNAPATDNPPVLRNVQRGRLADDGTVTDWTAMPPLPVGLCTHAAFFYGGYLYVGGGADNQGPEKGVWRAPIDATHTLGAWEDVAPLSIARQHVHQFPIFHNHVYSIAGALDQSLNSTDVIDIGTFQ